jgi:hypothetical protein
VVAQTSPQQVVIKMSATRELLPDVDHIGSSPGGGGVIVEMAPHPVTIVKDAGEVSQAEAGSKGTHCEPAKS